MTICWPNLANDSGIQVWTVSMPVTVLNSPIVNRYPQPAFNKATDILAVIGFGIGIIMETVSDIQKYKFKQNHKERGAVCNKGFFAWSRHPNYFAEILIQFCKSAIEYPVILA